MKRLGRWEDGVNVSPLIKHPCRGVDGGARLGRGRSASSGYDDVAEHGTLDCSWVQAWPGRIQPTGGEKSEGGCIFVGVVARAIALWPSPGLRGDLDQFVLWVHGFATRPFGNAYDQNLSFPPVMAYLWGLLAALEPAFRTVTTSADPGDPGDHEGCRPASPTSRSAGSSLAPPRPSRAGPSSAALAILLHPAVIDVSAWWGQYESIYVLVGLVAYVLAVARALPAGPRLRSPSRS